jgi:ABC-2 type transport system permease protein
MFHTSGTKHGSYSVGLTVLVIAIVIVFNLVIGQIPEAYRNLDMSSTKIYEISDTTKDLLGGLNDKVDMKVLAVKKDTDDRIKTFISKYAALSDKINVEWIDPVLHPSALTEYNTSENTIVVSCEATGKTTTISFDKILVMDMSSYYSGNASYSEFDGDGQLTSAVNYVTSNVQKTIYKVSGHGEAELSSTVTDLMSKNNYTLTELNLLMADSIPDDCDLLLMNAPTNDLSENEVTLLTNYLAAGGKVMCLLGDTSLTDFPNLASVLKVYGIEGVDGYIADPTRCYQNQPYYIFPQLNVSGDLANGISSQMVLLTNAHGMTLTILPVGLCICGNRHVPVCSDGKSDDRIYQYIWYSAYLVSLEWNSFHASKQCSQRIGRCAYHSDSDCCLYLSDDRKYSDCRCDRSSWCDRRCGRVLCEIKSL